MESASLFELNEYVRRVFALNFPEPIWISCEIAQIKEVRGNYYLDLVEQNDRDDVIAQASAVIWYKSFLFIRSKLGAMTTALLQPGIDIKIKIKVDFSERYGYKLVIEDIDPTYTVGKLELARQNIIERLKKEEVWGLNKTVPIPTVIQRIALISSDKAAGYADFMSQLNGNQFGYAFKVTLYQSSMQGQNTERDVCQALDSINASYKDFDVVVIIRGGGSKMDLSFFDNFNIGYKISTAKLPVITGIGHEIDESIADMTACVSLKTPTACAAMIVDTALEFEAEIQEVFHQIEAHGKFTIERLKSELETAAKILINLPGDKIKLHHQSLENFEYMLKTSTVYKIKHELSFLDQATTITEFSDPIQLLKKGYAMVRQNQSLIKSAEKFEIGQKATIIFSDGSVEVN